jgi:hypothetical protein
MEDALMNAKPASLVGDRRDRNVVVSGLLWFALFLAARAGLEIEALEPAWRVLIALVPVPAFAWFLWSFIRAIGQMDELERRIQLEALAFAFPMTLLLLMTLGLMQLAIDLSMDDWSYRHIWPIVVVLYFGGIALARKRYA